MNWLLSLSAQNAPLFWYSLLCFAFGLLCIVLMKLTTRQIMGVNAYLKPLKFFLSVGVFCYTMGLMMQYLNNQTQVTVYSWVLITGMSIELIIIIAQAARGRMSHFNVATPLDGTLFTIMGAVILVVTLWTSYIALLFFTQTLFSISMPIVWGIRLGIVVSILFAFVGGIMGGRLQHSVGGPDGEPGLPLLNWSKKHGDLRIPHFFGLHALQAIPLISLMVTSVVGVVIAALVYTGLVCYTLFRALKGKALF